MVGHVSLILVSVLFQEVILEISWTDHPNNESFARSLTWLSFYKKLNLFPHEFSALRLVLIAKETFQKFDTDYRIATFCNLLWIIQHYMIYQYLSALMEVRMTLGLLLSASVLLPQTFMNQMLH